jgi:hypothetical protein
MLKYTIKVCPARKPYPDYKMLDIEIEKDWAEFFCSLPHHCVPDCCGYGGMIFDAETMESFYLKIEHPRFQDWLIEAIKIIESNTRHLKKRILVSDRGGGEI